MGYYYWLFCYFVKNTSGITEACILFLVKNVWGIKQAQHCSLCRSLPLIKYLASIKIYPAMA